MSMTVLERSDVNIAQITVMYNYSTRMLFLRCIVSFLLITKIESARILCIYAFPSFSHQLVFREFSNALAQKGHELIIITPIPSDVKSENVTEIDTSDIIPILKKSISEHPLKRGIKITADLITLERQMALYDIIKATFNIEEVKNLINDKTQKFDLIISQPSFLFPNALAKVFNAPMVLFSTAYGSPNNYELFGAPSRHPFIYGHCFRDRRYNLSLWEKLYEFYIELRLWYIYSAENRMEIELVKEYFGDKAPSVEEVNDAADLMFLNVNPIFEGNRPVPPNIIHLGGIHLKPPKELSQEWKSYLDKSENGIIYVSLGTNVRPSVMEPELLEVFLTAFEQLPFDVLWKFDTDALPRNISNLHIKKWLPQRDLLFHPKVKAFVTQGGLQSTDEAIDAGVPLVGLPMLADQSYNCEQYAKLGIGVNLEVLTMTAEDLIHGITTVAENQRYQENIAKLGAVMRDQSQSPLDRAVWWTEYVLRHHRGAKHLRSSSFNISLFEFLMMDVIILVSLSLLLVIFIINLVWSYVKGYTTAKVKIN